MRLLIAANNGLHRLMHGRCWNPRVCEWLSYYEAMKDDEKGRNHVSLRGLE